MPFTLLLSDEATPYRVYFWRSGKGKGDVYEECPDLTPGEFQKLAEYSRRYVATGAFPKNKEKFKPVEDKLFEIKPSSQLRLLGKFRTFGKIKAFVIVLCIRKKQDKLARTDIKTAQDRWTESCKDNLDKSEGI